MKELGFIFIVIIFKLLAAALKRKKHPRMKKKMFSLISWLCSYQMDFFLTNSFKKKKEKWAANRTKVI